VRTHFLVLAALVALAAGCGSSGRQDVSSEPPTGGPPSGGPMPTAVPAADGKVTTSGLVTVLDAGSGPELCLGGVAESYPPQCGGPKLVGFSWDERAGQFEQANGVRWGEFAVTGTFDGVQLRVTGVIPEALYDAARPPHEEDRLATPCPEPKGGWRVLDPAKTTPGSMQAVFERARRLPGYAEAWLDQSRNPARKPDNDPAHATINVRVTREPARAEAELRKVWGGALCVTRAEHTEAELLRVQRRLQHLPGMLTASSSRDVVDVEVVHDDGTLQAWVDATYGPGLVRISSALVPASG